jgi:hypothetical protein
MHPNWDFMILQANAYPEVGIAVSNSPSPGGSVGKGWEITFVGKYFQQKFICPCACCSVWCNGLQYVAEDKDMRATWMKMTKNGTYGMKYEDYCGELLGAELISKKCKEVGVNRLLLHCFFHDDSWLPNRCQGLTFIEPCRTKEAWDLNQDLFAECFDELLKVEKYSTFYEYFATKVY